METGKSDFRKLVRKALVDQEKTISWLAGEINAATGKHFDGSYLIKAFDGKKKSRTVIEETCRILNLALPEEYKQ